MFGYKYWSLHSLLTIQWSDLCFHYSPLLSFKTWSSLVTISFSFFGMEGKFFCICIWTIVYAHLYIYIYIFFWHICVYVLLIKYFLRSFGTWLVIINLSFQSYSNFKMEWLEQLQHLFSGVSKCDTTMFIEKYRFLCWFALILLWYWNLIINNSGMLNLKFSICWDYHIYTINLVVWHFFFW